MDTTTFTLSKVRCIPMVKLYTQSQAPKLIQALRDSGVRAVNVSQQGGDGPALLKILSKEETLLVGAGNVQTYEQAERAIHAGAAFIFSPLFDERMIELCHNRRVPIYPVTTQANLAVLHQLKVLGCYPVEELGGLSFIDRMAAEGDFSFFVAGHIDESMMNHYLNHPHVLGMTGSWMFKDADNWKAVTEALIRTKQYWLS